MIRRIAAHSRFNGPVYAWPWQTHKTYDKMQHSRADGKQGWGLATAECICGAHFEVADSPFTPSDLARWEKSHRA